MGKASYKLRLKIWDCYKLKKQLYEQDMIFLGEIPSIHPQVSVKRCCEMLLSLGIKLVLLDTILLLRYCHRLTLPSAGTLQKFREAQN